MCPVGVVWLSIFPVTSVTVLAQAVARNSNLSADSKLMIKRHTYPHEERKEKYSCQLSFVVQPKERLAMQYSMRSAWHQEKSPTATGLLFCLQEKIGYKEHVRSKTCHQAPSLHNVQIEAPCNYPICCFRSASRSRRHPAPWILFVHSLTILYDLNSLTVCPQPFQVALLTSSVLTVT